MARSKTDHQILQTKTYIYCHTAPYISFFNWQIYAVISLWCCWLCVNSVWVLQINEKYCFHLWVCPFYVLKIIIWENDYTQKPDGRRSESLFHKTLKFHLNLMLRKNIRHGSWTSSFIHQIVYSLYFSCKMKKKSTRNIQRFLKPEEYTWLKVLPS